MTKRQGTFATVAALTAALFVAPALAQTTMPSAPPPTPPTAAPAAPSATPAPAMARTKAPAKTNKRMSAVEARIKSLRSRLHITAAQEPQWQQVAQAMRDNAETIEKMVRDRQAKLRTMSAVDNLQTYADIAQAHADGLKKLMPAFDTLYQSMSASQKKTADAVFRGIVEHHAKKAATHKPASPAPAPSAPVKQ
ncbi:MAG: Spy/CpxP family protein refolding chaperone [Stellaceae bacterium]